MSLRDSAEVSRSLDQRPASSGCPDVVALEQLHRFDACLAALATLQHALHGFERVEIHVVHVAHTHHHGLLHACAERYIDVGQAPRDGHRRSGHQRKFESLGGLHHALRFGKAEGELLVIEVWNGVLFCLEDLGALLEEIVARKQDLSTVVAGVGVVAALFDDGEHGVDGDAVAATAQSFGNVVAEAEAELLRARRAEIARQPLLFGGRRHGLPTLIGSGLSAVRRRGLSVAGGRLASSGDRQLKFVRSRGGPADALVHVHRDDLHIRHVPVALVGIADEEAVGDRLQIGTAAIGAAEDRKTQRALCG